LETHQVSPWAYFGAPELDAIAAKYSISPRLRPITVIEENGGIPLRKRPLARQEYHVVELARWRKRLGVNLNLTPKFYPLAPGDVSIPAEAIIRAQAHFGSGSAQARAFSYAIQTALWSEEQNIADVDTLLDVAEKAGIPTDLAQTFCVDNRADDEDAAVKEFQGNYKAAEPLGTYMITCSCRPG
jgi:2-hydroxychromene-2-carboxylate isomerase